MTTAEERLGYLRVHKVGECTRCPLHLNRNNIVFGEGNPEADVMFVGEAPGAKEDQTGRPFVGAAGKELDAWIEAVGLERGDVYIANTVKCLKGETLVHMADGSRKRIRDLVRESHEGPVLTVNPDTGHLEAGKIVGWHRNKMEPAQHWLRLSFEEARQCGAQGGARAVVTNDHRVLTREGWKRADEICSEDEIATGLPDLTESQYQVALGTLLGDAHGDAKSASLSLGHSISQEEWLRYKARVFGIDTVSHSGTEGAPRAYIPASLGIKRLRDQIYTMRGGKRRKRRAPPQVLRNLGPLGLAVWFLDDGYMRLRESRRPRAEIGTYDFTDRDRDVMCSRLSEMGVYPTVGSRGQLIFDIHETSRLQRIVAPFVPAPMRRKLSEEFHEIPFDDTAYRAPAATTTIWSTPRIERPTGRFFADKTTYCIDVAPHANFVTPGGVVHNCRPLDNRDPYPQEKEACSPFLHTQIFLVRPKVLVALGRHAANTLTAQKLSMGALREEDLRYENAKTDLSIPVVAVFHPSYVLRKGRGETQQEALRDLRRALEIASS